MGFPPPNHLLPSWGPPRALQMGRGRTHRGASGTGSRRDGFNLHLLPRALPALRGDLEKSPGLDPCGQSSVTLSTHLGHLRRTKVAVTVLLERCTACICQDLLGARHGTRSGGAARCILPLPSLWPFLCSGRKRDTGLPGQGFLASQAHRQVVMAGSLFSECTVAGRPRRTCRWPALGNSLGGGT